MKKLSDSGPKNAELQFNQKSLESEPDLGNNGFGSLVQPRGSGNDMNFWFGEQNQADMQPRGSGNDRHFKNMLASPNEPKEELIEPAVAS